jgi:deoxyadenosine/deoxycytidine kinase
MEDERRVKIMMVSLDGLIGSGKSTRLQPIYESLKSLGDHVEVIQLREPVEEFQKYGILGKFYEDSSRYGYTFQTYAVLTRIKLLREAIKSFSYEEKEEMFTFTMKKLDDIINLLHNHKDYTLHVGDRNSSSPLSFTTLCYLESQRFKQNLHFPLNELHILEINDAIELIGNNITREEWKNEIKQGKEKSLDDRRGRKDKNNIENSKVKIKVILTERSLSTDILFMKTLYRRKTITEMEWQLYKCWVDEWKNLIPSIKTVYIYLRTPLSVAIERIKKRNREQETSIDVDYLNDLSNVHDDFFLNLCFDDFSLNLSAVDVVQRKTENNVLILDGTQDILEDETHWIQQQKDIVDFVRSHM